MLWAEETSSERPYSRNSKLSDDSVEYGYVEKVGESGSECLNV